MAKPRTTRELDARDRERLLAYCAAHRFQDPIDPDLRERTYGLLAERVIRAIDDDPDLRKRARRARAEISNLIAAYSENKGGRGKAPRTSVADAIKALCLAMGWPVVDHDTVKRVRRRARRG